MKPWVREVVLPAAAGGVAIASVLSVLWLELAVVPERRSRGEALRADLRELDRIAESARRYTPHLRALDSACAASPTGRSPLDLFAGAAPGLPPPVLSATREVALDAHWRITQVDLAMADVPLDAVSAFLQACATSRPPWRVSALRLQALDAGSTRARAVLTLESPARREEAARP